MKKSILLTFLMSLMMIMLISCGGTPKELKLPNKSVKYENGVLTYKGKPYTGKIVTNLADKISGYEGFITLKDGHLDGQTKVKSEKKKEEFELNVKDGKFDGQYVAKMPSIGEITIVSEAGMLKKLQSNLVNGIKQDLTFNDAGLANGTMEADGQKFNFKDGSSPISGNPDAKIVLKYVKENNSFATEVYQGDKLIQKEENKLEFDVNTLESQLFPELLSGN